MHESDLLNHRAAILLQGEAVRDPSSMEAMRGRRRSHAIGLPTRLNVARPTLHQVSAEPPAPSRTRRPECHVCRVPRVPRAACAACALRQPLFALHTLHPALCALQVSSDSLNQQEHAQERKRSLAGRPSLAGSKSAASLLDRLGTFVPTAEAA